VYFPEHLPIRVKKNILSVTVQLQCVGVCSGCLVLMTQYVLNYQCLLVHIEGHYYVTGLVGFFRIILDSTGMPTFADKRKYKLNICQYHLETGVTQHWKRHLC
jgi:hypothetical protein